MNLKGFKKALHCQVKIKELVATFLRIFYKKTFQKYLMFPKAGNLLQEFLGGINFYNFFSKKIDRPIKMVTAFLSVET